MQGLTDAMLLQFYGELMAEAEPEKRATRRFALRLPVAVTYTTTDRRRRPPRLET